MRTTAVVLLLSSACATTTPSSPMIIPPLAWPSDTQVRWYDVSGGSEASLRAALSASGPIDQTGERHDAFTEWYVTWHFPSERGPEGCSTGTVSTALRVSITLPRWHPPAEAPKALIDRWRQYLEALAFHELGHRGHALEAAADIETALPLLEARPTCEEAERLANEAAHRIIERLRRADLEYDSETDHGATQGAVFP